MIDTAANFNWLEFAANFGPSALFVIMLIRMISKEMKLNTIAVNKMLVMTATIRDDLRALARARNSSRKVTED
jgi:hypothetical protein